MVTYRNSDIFLDKLISKTKRKEIEWRQMPNLANMRIHSMPLKRRIDFFSTLENTSYLPERSFYTENEKGIFVLLSYRNEMDEIVTEVIPISYKMGHDYFPIPMPDFAYSLEKEKIDRLILCIQFELGSIDEDSKNIDELLNLMIE